MWHQAKRTSPEYVQGRFSQVNAVGVHRVKQKLEHLWPLVVPIVICKKEYNINHKINSGNIDVTMPQLHSGLIESLGEPYL